jgi:PIN domain nuclease of toxin-antitoxin system
MILLDTHIWIWWVNDNEERYAKSPYHRPQRSYYESRHYNRIIG